MLEVTGLSVAYGEAVVLQGVSFRARAGEVTCVLGPNGVGKTTLLRSVMGLVPPSAGAIRFLDEAIEGRKTHEIVRRGLTMIPEGRRLWPSLTVRENLEMGAYVRAGDRDVGAELERVLTRFPVLRQRARQLGGTLSGGEQQMLAVARILRTGAHLLLLDEISEGLAPVIVNKLGEMIRTLKAKGYTVVMVEQNFRFAAPLADRFYVMEHGRIVESFGAAQLREKESTLHELLGV